MQQYEHKSFLSVKKNVNLYEHERGREGSNAKRKTLNIGCFREVVFSDCTKQILGFMISILIDMHLIFNSLNDTDLRFTFSKSF